MDRSSLTKIALNNRVLMLILSAVIFFSGIFIYTILPRQEYPIVNAPAVIITVVYPGASTLDMENLVAKKLEDVAMKTVGFDYIETTINDSVCTARVMFDLDLDQYPLDKSINTLRDDVFALQNNGFPKGVTNIYYNSDLVKTSGMILAITSEERSNKEITQRANILKNELRNIEGVKDVELDGEYENQIEVVIDYNKLNKLNISLAEVVDVINYGNSLIPIGNLEYSDDKIKVTSGGKLEDLDEIKNIIVNINDDGIITKLSNIATINYGINENNKSYYYNGNGAVILNLYYENGINITKVENEIQDKITEFTSTTPKDISINTAINLSDDVEDSVNSFSINLIQSIIIVLMVVMIGMSFKNGIIVAVAIPLSISIPFIGMMFFGIEIQFISLAALIISLGMLVDNAIVVCDSIQVHLNNGMEKRDACITGTKIVAYPVLTSTLTTIVMFAIFYVLPGTMLKFSFSLPTVVIIALLSSYLVSILITPIMCFYFMKPEREKNKKEGLISKNRKKVMKIVDVTFRFKKTTLIIATCLFAIAVYSVFNTSLSFMPKSEKPLVDIKVYADTNTDIRKTEEIVKEISQIIEEQEETLFYLTTVGGSVPKYDFSSMPIADNINLGSFILRIDTSKSPLTKSQFVENLQNTINTRIGGNIVVTELAVLNNPRGEQVQVRLTGDNWTNLNEQGNIIANKLKGIEGIRNVNVSNKNTTYTINVQYKDDTINSNGLTRSEIANEMNIATMGRESTIIRNDTIEYPVIVKTNINSISELENLKIKSSQSGSKYSIKQLANITLEENMKESTRYNGYKTVTISGIPKNGYSSIDIQRQLKNEIDNMDLTGVSLSYEGDWDIMAEALSKLLVGAIFGIIAILIILYLQFKSFRLAFIVLLSIPFCLVGAVLGIFVFNAAFDFYTILGIVSLIGVVVNNAIILVDFIENERKNLDIDSACKMAVQARFRPVMLSTTTSVLGMIPLAIGGSILFRGLAIAFMSGLTISMCFTFIVIPIIYSLIAKKDEEDFIQIDNI